MNTYPTQAQLLKKYDTPTPRYTSYPAVPHWHAAVFSNEQWIEAVRRSFRESNHSKGISLYLHLPFCESLCTYCACNKRITVNHQVEAPYIKALLNEWAHYKRIFGEAPVIRELHLGGGTPTFFSAENLQLLITTILKDTLLHENFEFSFEGHPNNTTRRHLETLYNLGFRRVSFGVQDLDDRVQKAINRMQPFENLRAVTEAARDIGYKSVSFDLIYGLPFQTPLTVSDTIEKVLTLRPDRLSFYSYAHVPWIQPGQRGYSETDLPHGELKRHLYEIGRHMLKKRGYADIGMDHFSLPHDSLFKAHVHNKLHRNFMGYTTTDTDLLIGLGASSISDAKYAYAQNVKKVEDYLDRVNTTGEATFKGHMLSVDDRLVKLCILQLSCNRRLEKELLTEVANRDIWTKLHEMEGEGILYVDQSGLKITTAGEPFIRNICSVFDSHFAPDKGKQIFSNAI